MGEAIKHRGIKQNVTSIDNIHVYFTWLPIVNERIPEQPFVKGKWMVWLNGFISNYRELAEKYEIDLWADSDTLFLSEFLNKFGFAKLQELNGFFAVLVYDQKEKEMHWFTDRHGIKQLYFHAPKKSNKVYIASEVKGLLKIIPKPEISLPAAHDWFYSLGVMTHDTTIFKSVWKIASLLDDSRSTPFYGSYEEAKERLQFLLNQSFSRNKIKSPNIKTGVFLSGGIDSGIIAKNIGADYSFSMDYVDKDLSEIENIKLNSRSVHLGMICNDNMYDYYKSKTIQALDDLKAGSSYTNFALTELASKYVKVLYSGAGSDELFYGYTHRYNRNINDVIRRTSASGPNYNITHEEYDQMFLRAILIVEDRMAGYHTLETRYPFLDNDLVDFVRSLPKAWRENKRILKDISDLPKQIVEGKKRGFSNPVSNEEWVKFALNETCRLYNII
jgi:asparagine synthase (glutamine-hydrolysing)